MCVIEFATWQILSVNESFARWLGYNEQTTKIFFADIVYKKDLKNLTARLQHSDGTLYVEEQLRLVGVHGELKDARVNIQITQNYLLLTFDDQQMHREIEQELKEQILTANQRTTQTAKCLIEWNEILQRFQQMPLLLKKLREQKQHTNLWQLAIVSLCDEKCLGYGAGAIFGLVGEKIELLCSSSNYPLHHFNLRKKHPLAQLARGESGWVFQNKEMAVSIFNQDNKVIGLLLVTLQESENNLLSGNTELEQAHRCFLQTFAQCLGILYQNISQEQKLEQTKVELERMKGILSRNHQQLS